MAEPTLVATSDEFPAILALLTLGLTPDDLADLTARAEVMHLTLGEYALRILLAPPQPNPPAPQATIYQ